MMTNLNNFWFLRKIKFDKHPFPWNHPMNSVEFARRVLLSFSKIPSHVVVNDGSGDVTLVLPGGPAAYQVHASTRSGDSSITVPTSPSSPHVITVTVGSGNITVTR